MGNIILIEQMLLKQAVPEPRAVCTVAQTGPPDLEHKGLHLVEAFVTDAREESGVVFVIEVKVSRCAYA